jgi:hypothetical protein
VIILIKKDADDKAMKYLKLDLSIAYLSADMKNQKITYVTIFRTAEIINPGLLGSDFLFAVLK